jgi:hypothetical protein
MCCWDYFILCEGGWYDHFDGSKCYCKQANKSNWDDIGEMCTIVGLHCLKFRCKSAILRIRYGDEYTLQHIIFILAWSCNCSHFFMGWNPQNGELIKLNGAFHVELSILQFVGAPTAKAKRDFFGLVAKLNKICTHSHDIQARKILQIINGTPNGVSLCSCMPLVLGHGKLSPFSTQGTNSQSSERVCWNPRWRVPS